MADRKLQFVSDVHFPRHNKRMVSLWLDVMRWYKPHEVDLVGDIDDAEGTSQWVAGTTKEGFSIEDAGITNTRDFLIDINSIVPRAEKHFHDGNHGWYRHEKWLDKNNPQSLQDELYTPETLYEYDKAGFQFHKYDDPPVKRWDDLYVHHGEAIGSSAGQSVAKDCLNMGISLLRGHSHRQAMWHQSYPIDGRVLRGYEIGHMADHTQMKYVMSPNWLPGFAIGLEHNGRTHIQLITINENDMTCVVNGKVFSG